MRIGLGVPGSCGLALHRYSAEPSIESIEDLAAIVITLSTASDLELHLSSPDLTRVGRKSLLC